MKTSTSGFNDNRIKSSIDEAKSYQYRKKKKHQAEMAMIKKALSTLEQVNTALDIPCGVGRASILLNQEGLNVTAIDAGAGAIFLAKKEFAAIKADISISEGDIRNIPYPAQSFDIVLCFRFFHHLQTEDARRHIINELCKVSSKYVLLSYFSPYSFTSIRRYLKSSISKIPSSQNATSLSEVKHYFEANNFKFKVDYAQMPFLHTLHLAVFSKE